MILSNVNIGTAPSSGDGDPLRSAFSIINNNFQVITNNVNSLTNSVTSVAGRTGNVVLTINDIVGINYYATQANVTTANVGMRGYVDAQITANVALLVNAAPSTLDTIRELADAIGDDPNFAVNVALSVSSANTKMRDYVDGQILAANAGVVAANLGMKGYVDSLVNTYSNVNVQAYLITNSYATQSYVNTANTSMKDYVDGQITAANTNVTYSNINTKSYLLSGVEGNIIPSANVTYSLGSPTAQWKDLWVSNNTIYIGGVPLSVSADGNLLVNGAPVSSGVSTGDITFTNDIISTSTGSVNIETDTGVVWEFNDGGSLSFPGATASIYGDANTLELFADSNSNNGIGISSSETRVINTGSVNIVSDTDSNEYTWSFGAGGNLTLPGGLIGYQPTVGYERITLQPSPDVTQNFLFYVDQTTGTFNRAGMELPYADVDKAVTLAFPHNNSTVGYVYTQGTDTSATEFNNAFNVMHNGGNVKISALTYENGNKIWNFTTTGNVIFPDSTTQTTAWTGAATQIANGNTSVSIDQVDGNIAFVIGNTDYGHIKSFGQVAIGTSAGNTSQGVKAIGIGEVAGRLNQGVESVGLGAGAGEQNQGAFSVAIGSTTAYYNQGIGAVAIGAGAGALLQGLNAIAIGAGAGAGAQGNNSIIINATGNTLDQTTANTFTVAPIRNATSSSGVLQYDSSTSEVTYNTHVTLANVLANYVTINNGLVGFAASPAPTISGFESAGFIGNVQAGNVKAVTAYRFSSGLVSINNADNNVELNPDTNASALAGVKVGGNGYILGPNGGRNITLNYGGASGVVGMQANVFIGTGGSGNLQVYGDITARSISSNSINGNVDIVAGNVANVSATKTRIVSDSAYSYIQTGNGVAGSTGNIVFSPYLSPTQQVVIDTASGSITASGKIGFVNGGFVQQATSNSTGVTSNTTSGNIQLMGINLGVNAIHTVPFSNNKLEETDMILVTHHSGGVSNFAVGAYYAAPGTAVIWIRNITGQDVSTTYPILKFALIKAPGS